MSDLLKALARLIERSDPPYARLDMLALVVITVGIPCLTLFVIVSIIWGG